MVIVFSYQHGDAGFETIKIFLFVGASSVINVLYNHKYHFTELFVDKLAVFIQELNAEVASNLVGKLA